MGVFIDLTGQKLGRWEVKERIPSNDKIAWWKCECQCGNIRVVKSGDLRNGKSKSCGCLSSEVTSKLMRTHGKSKTRTYRIWKGMKARCYIQSEKRYMDYGGRGISVCDEWLNSYETFLRDMGECPKGYSIERLDVNGNYEPSNCKWIPLKDQARNRRKQKSNTSGYNGVYYIKERNSWAAIWTNIDGKKRSKSFSIKKYGDLAKELANEKRIAEVQKLRDSGVYYGDKHGQ